MKEFFLKLNSDGSLNGCYLSVWENDKENILISSIQESTKKGWKSSKKIFEKLDIIYKESETDVIITEEFANSLILKYGNIKTKSFTSSYDINISPAHVIANFITKNNTDPYDRG